MQVIRDRDTVTVDLHGLRTEDARFRLEHLLSGLPAEVREVRVIHGCNHGTALLSMVRDNLHHPRIAAKLPALNPGETRLLLK